MRTDVWIDCPFLSDMQRLQLILETHTISNIIEQNFKQQNVQRNNLFRLL